MFVSLVVLGIVAFFGFSAYGVIFKIIGVVYWMVAVFSIFNSEFKKIGKVLGIIGFGIYSIAGFGEHMYFVGVLFLCGVLYMLSIDTNEVIKTTKKKPMSDPVLDRAKMVKITFRDYNHGLREFDSNFILDEPTKYNDHYDYFIDSSLLVIENFEKIRVQLFDDRGNEISLSNYSYSFYENKDVGFAFLAISKRY